MWQDDRVRFQRERASGYYGSLSYFFAKYLIDCLVLRILPAVVFALITYWLIGWNQVFSSEFVNQAQFKESSGCPKAPKLVNSGICKTDPLTFDQHRSGGEPLGYYVLSLALSSVAASAVVATVGVSTKSAKVANVVSVLIVLVLIMFSGALVSQENMPFFIKWIAYISPFAFTFESLLIGTFVNQCFIFNPKTVAQLTGQSSAFVCAEIPGYKWLL